MSQAGIIDVITNNPSIATQFNADTGFAVPIGNILDIRGAPGSGISTFASGNTIFIQDTVMMTWQTIIASQTLVVDNGYICIAPGGALALLLPPVSVVGNIIEVTLDGSASFTIHQGAGQSIRIGNLSTTAGVGGSLGTTQQGDTLRMVCSVANLKWNVLSSMGNPKII